MPKMNLRLILFCALVFCSAANAQSRDLVNIPPKYGWLFKVDSTGKECWHNIFGYPRDTFFMSGICTSDGGYAMIGHIASDGAGNRYIGEPLPYVVVTDSLGNLLWDREYPVGKSGLDYGTSLVQMEDGGFAVAGWLSVHDRRGPDDTEHIWVIRTDAIGNPIWTKIIGGTWSLQNPVIIRRASEALLIACCCTTTDHYARYLREKISWGNGWLAELDLNGNVLWSSNYGGKRSDTFASLCHASDSAMVIAGTTYGKAPLEDRAWLLCVTGNGSSLWEHEYKILDYSSLRSVVAVRDGYLASGEAGDAFMQIKIDLQGDSLWARTYQKGGYCSVTPTSDGGSVLVGATSALGAGSSDALLIKTTSEGEEEWQRTYGGKELDQCRVAIPTGDGGYILIGSTGSFTQ